MSADRTDSGKSVEPTAESASRRRLLQAGLGASPAILTLVSAPVRAGYAHAKTASAFGSVTTAVSHTHAMLPTSGRKPSWWASCSMSEWPSSCKTSGGAPKRFRDVFTDFGHYGSKTLKECLQLGASTGMDGVAKHCVAAYLNAATNRVPAVLCSTQAAKDIWIAYTTRGYFEPTAGVKWFADSCTPAGVGGINPWLITTMPN
jgi:hypothetical protein